jgi:hypothetical protein
MAETPPVVTTDYTMESILTSIKKMLGVGAEDTSFDQDITIFINSMFINLNQLGVGPVGGFSITDTLDTWADYFGENPVLESAKTYIYLKVRLIFDPPSSSFVLEAIKNQISEIEWRLNVKVENELLEAEGAIENGE